MSQGTPTSEVPVEVVVAAFDTEHGADDALKRLKEVQKQKIIGIRNAAVLRKDGSGKLHLQETEDMRGGKGATIGGVIGAAVGLMTGTFLITTVGGAVIGGLAAKLRDSGFSDERLKQVAEGLKPNTSALITVIEHTWVKDVEQRLREYGANIVTEEVRADIARQLEEQAATSAGAMGAPGEAQPGQQP